MIDIKVYEKLTKSIDILNKSITVQEKNTVILFSYLYNLYQDKEKENKDLKNKISMLENRLEKVEFKINIVKIPFYKKWYNNIYHFIFKKKLEKEQQEKERLEKEKLEEEQKKRKEENKKRIREILQNTRPIKK